MNIVLLGAGAMGSLFGARLAQAGHAVTLVDIARAHLDAIAAHGLRLDSAAGSAQVPGLAVFEPKDWVGRVQAPGGRAPELLIVFTKTLHTEAALRGVAGAIGPQTQVLSLQNGLGNVEKLAAVVDPARILVGVTTWPADLIGPGHVASHGAGSIRLMQADGRRSAALEQAASALQSAGLNCEIDERVWHAIWEKVAFNAALNTLCTVTGCTVDQLALAEDGPELALEIVQEVVAVARASGFDVAPGPVCDKVLHAIAAHAGHHPSMAQDMQAGRPTEIDSINGAVVARAEALGVAVPATRTLMRLVRLMQARAALPAPG